MLDKKPTAAAIRKSVAHALRCDHCKNDVVIRKGRLVWCMDEQPAKQAKVAAVFVACGPECQRRLDHGVSRFWGLSKFADDFVPPNVFETTHSELTTARWTKPLWLKFMRVIWAVGIETISSVLEGVPTPAPRIARPPAK